MEGIDFKRDLILLIQLKLVAFHGGKVDAVKGMVDTLAAKSIKELAEYERSL